MSEEAALERVLLDPANPHDFSDGSLEELAGALGAQLGDAEVEIVRRDEEGYGGPLYEALSIWIAGGGLASATLAILTLKERVSAYIKERFEEDAESCGEGEEPRPRSASFYDLQGRALFTVRIEAPGGEVLEEEGGEDSSRPFPG